MNRHNDLRALRAPRIASVLACFALLASAKPAEAQSRDAEALEIAADALSNDYARGAYLDARKKLRQALKKCSKRRCSRDVRGSLYRALGAAYVGDGKAKLARGAFERAVKIDPKGRLQSDLESPEVNAAFLEAGGWVEGSEPRSAEGEEPAEDDAADESEEDDSAADDRDKKPARNRGSRSWLSLGAQQDWLLYSDTKPVCGSREYTCLVGEAEYKGDIWDEYGNEVRGGLALATTRVLLGFEHLLGDNFALGLRLGFAFRGGPTLRNNEKFLPIHAELRVGYYFGSKPFADSGIRPYLAVGGGLAEVRSRVDVDFFQDAAAYNEARKRTLDGWRNTGRAFVAPTLGTQFALTRTSAILLELRWMVMLGTSGSAPAAGIGFAQGL